MFANWKWDAQHTVLAIAFFAGLAGAIITVAGGLPPGITPMQALGIFVPLAGAFLTAAFSFFKNPPNTPEQAFEEGKNATKGGSSGFSTVGAIAVLAVATVIGVVGATLAGCDWFKQNQPVIVQDITKDASCVLSNVLSSGGTASPAAIATSCAPMTVAQAEAIATSLFDYYALGQTDGGAALTGAALPPYKGIPVALAPSDFAKLRTFCTAAASGH